MAERLSSTHTYGFLAIGYFLAILFGAHAIPPLPVREMLDVVALSICGVGWVLVDARRQGRPIPTLGQSWFLMFPFLLVPGHILVSRGWLGIVWLVLIVVSWPIVATAGYHAAGYLVYGEGWLAAFGL